MGSLPLLLGLIPAAGSPLPVQADIARVGKKKPDEENSHLSLGSMPEACKGLGVYEGGVESACCWVTSMGVGVAGSGLDFGLLSISPPLPPAMQQVLDNLGSLPNATGAAELDLIFLRGIMESPIVRSLAKVWCIGEVGGVPGNLRGS